MQKFMSLKNTIYIFNDKKHTRNYKNIKSLVLMTETIFFIHYHLMVSPYSITQSNYDIPFACRQLLLNFFTFNCLTKSSR